MAMSDRDLLNRIRAVMTELDQLIAGADFNSKYHTKARLIRACSELAKAEGSLAWHVDE